jgi:hypothetical protein
MPSTATTRTVTGLTNGTAYTFRVAGVNGIGTGAFSSASSAVTPTAVTPDPYFSDVILLLPANNSSADSSSYSRSPSAWSSYGAAKFGSASFSFTGSAPAISLPSDTPSIGSGDYTIECWFKTADSGLNALASAGAITWYLIVNGGGINYYSPGGSLATPGGVNYADNAWHHVAGVRSGSTVSLYVDGELIATRSSTASMDGTVEVGYSSYYDWRCNALVDDLRITKVARYTANFTPPTAAFPTA